MRAKAHKEIKFNVFPSQSAVSGKEDIDDRIARLGDGIDSLMGRASCLRSSSCGWTQCNSRCAIRIKYAGIIHHAVPGNLLKDRKTIRIHPGVGRHTRACA